MLYYRFEVELHIEEPSEFHPDLNIIEGWWSHCLILENDFAELIELVDLLRKGKITIDLLLLSSSFRQMSVMYSTYLILYL